MKKNLFKVVVLIAAGALFLSGEAFARGGGGGGGGGAGLQTRSAMKIQTQSKYQTQTRTQAQQQLNQDGTGSQGTAQGNMRKLGPADGTDLQPRPQDGTGYGSPFTQTTE